jgi:ribulose-phosphate 3-epimerase
MTSSLVAASVLSCDYLKIGTELRSLESARVDLIHLDIMDGNFVPEISFGGEISRSIIGATSLPTEAHLMVQSPSDHVYRFLDIGCFRVTIHLESSGDILAILKDIRSRGAQAGLSIKPGTPCSAVEPFLNEIDMVLLMTVEPGWGGQGFRADAIPRLDEIRAIIGNRPISIEVDGGINAETGPLCSAHGAHVLVSGSFITGSQNREYAVQQLKQFSAMAQS